MLLPIDETEPKLIWVKSEKESEYTDFEIPEVGEHLANGERFAAYIYASYLLARSKPGQQRYNLDHTTVIYIRDEAETDGSTQNQCVVHMMKGTHRHDWKGPMVILSQPGTKIDPLVYQDVTATSLRVVVDFLQVYGTGLQFRESTLITGPAAMSRLFPEKPSNFVQGVEISSKGDVVLHGRMKFIEVQVPVDHSIFTISSTQISDQMGLPLLVKKVGGFSREDVERGNKMNLNAFQNRTALFLNMEANIRGQSWGYADLLEWDLEIERCWSSDKIKSP